MIASKFKTLIRLLRQLERVPVLEDQVAVLRRESSSVAGEVQKLGVVEQEMRDALIGSSERVEKSLENLVNWLRDDMASEQRKLSDARVEQSLSDLKRLLSVASFPPPRVILKTDHPIAVDSDDHRFPRGTLHDDTRWPRFCAAAESIFPGRKIRFLDIGCAGGGLVFDFLIRGHEAVGLEGSDLNRRTVRAHWGVIPSHLFTCDATQPFQFQSVGSGLPFKFDLITCWEVLEHIPERSLEQFFRNIKSHLEDGGLFVASVATFEDRDPASGAVWHVTVKPESWWMRILAASGLRPQPGRFEHEDFVRGSGNPTASDWDARKSPEMGFHIVAAHAA